MNISKKGSVFVIVLMVTTMVAIATGATYLVIDNSAKINEERIDDSKVYFAAESGAHVAYKWLTNQSYEDFNGNVNAINVASNFSKTVDVNDITATLSASVDTTSGRPIWKLTSIADDGNTKCTITLDSVIGVSVAQYTTHFFQEIDGGYLTDNQNYIGKAFFTGKVPLMQGDNSDEWCSFYGGMVESTSNSNTWTNKTHITNLIHGNDELNFWEKGLKLNFNQSYSGPTAVPDLVGDLNDIFRWGFETGAPVQDPYDMTYTWDEIRSDGGTLNITNDFMGVSLSNSYPLEITFNGSGTVTIKHRNKTKTVTQGTYNKIAVPGACGDVKLKGEVTHDMTIVTEYDDVHIIDDYYSSALKSYKDKDNDLFDDYDPDEDNIIKQLMSDNVQHNNVEMGIIGGLRNTGTTYLEVEETYGTDDENKIVFVTATFFSPNGKLRAEDNGRYFEKLNKLILLGSFVGDAEWYTQYGNRGISPNYITDSRYINGIRPPGFKTSLQIDPVYTDQKEQMITDLMVWRVAFEKSTN